MYICTQQNLSIEVFTYIFEFSNDKCYIVSGFIIKRSYHKSERMLLSRHAVRVQLCRWNFEIMKLKLRLLQRSCVLVRYLRYLSLRLQYRSLFYLIEHNIIISSLPQSNRLI